MNTSPSAVFLFLMVFHFLEDSRRFCDGLWDLQGFNGRGEVGVEGEGRVFGGTDQSVPWMGVCSGLTLLDDDGSSGKCQHGDCSDYDIYDREFLAIFGIRRGLAVDNLDIPVKR